MFSEFFKKFLIIEQQKKQIVILFVVLGFFISWNISYLYMDFCEFDLFRIISNHNTLVYLRSLIYIIVVLDVSLFFGVLVDSGDRYIRKEFKEKNHEK